MIWEIGWSFILLFPTLVSTRSGSMGIISGSIATPCKCVFAKLDGYHVNVNTFSREQLKSSWPKNFRNVEYISGISP
jgi:hypothetical protein